MDTSFGAYQLGEPFGALPFGDLVAASHPARSESLALLLLDARLSGDHRFRGLVRLEMARVGGLRQPGIARMLEISEQSGALAVVYERPADGTSLATRLAGGTALGQDAALGLIRRLAEALDAAHGRRIVHGLLGPGSILIGSDGTASLVGVGLLAAVEEAGLREYMLERADAASLAPDQKSGKLAVASADSYALAVLAEQLLAGATGQTRAALDRQQLPDAAQRFPTCVAFAAALSETAASAGAPAPNTPALSATGTSAGSMSAAAPPPYSPPPAPSYVAPDYAAPPPSYAVSPPTHAAPPAPAPIPPVAEPPEAAPSPAAPSPAALTSTAPPSPATTAPLPWNAPPPPATPSPGSTPAYARPPAHPTPQPPHAEPPAPSDGGLTGWLRDSLDPPDARGQRGPQTAPTQPSQRALPTCNRAGVGSRQHHRPPSRAASRPRPCSRSCGRSRRQTWAPPWCSPSPAVSPSLIA